MSAFTTQPDHMLEVVQYQGEGDEFRNRHRARCSCGWESSIASTDPKIALESMRRHAETVERRGGPDPIRGKVDRVADRGGVAVIKRRNGHVGLLALGDDPEAVETWLIENDPDTVAAIEEAEREADDVRHRSQQEASV